MATSGSKSIKVTNYDNLKFSWERTSYSLEDNTSTISWKMELVASTYGKIISSASKDWSVTVDGKKYSGSNSVAINNNSTITLASGSKVINHNADGSKTFSYSFSQEFNITFSGTHIGAKSGSGSGELTTIPRAATLKSAPNFNDEANPTISYTNPLGNAATALEACITDSEGKAIYCEYRSISKTGTSYTFELTDAERKTLRKAITKGNTLAVRFYIRTTIGDSRYFSSSTKTLSLINYKPTLAPVIKDVGTASTNLTNDENTIIKHFNYISITTGAAARKEATVKSVKVTCGSKSITTATGVMENVDSADFNITVTDSRGNTTTQIVKKTALDYFKVSCNIELVEKNFVTETTGSVTLKLNGSWFNGNFSFYASNILTLEYRIAEQYGDYGGWIAVEPTIDGNSFNLSFTPTQAFDYKKTYKIEARAVDMISNKYTEVLTVTFIPVFDWGESDFNFNVPVAIQGNTIADFVIAEGDNGAYAYRKWANGKLEAWRSSSKAVDVTASTAYGAMYYHKDLSVTTTGDASQFVEVDSIQLTLGNTAGYNGLWYGAVKNYEISSGAVTVNYMAVNPSQNTTAKIYPYVYIMGKWK